MNIFVSIGLIWLPESPEFLHEAKRFDKARDVLKQIAKFNGV